MKGSVGTNTSTIIHMPKWAKKRERRKIKAAKDRILTLKNKRLKVLG